MSSQGLPTLELDVTRRRTEKWVAAGCAVLAAGVPFSAEVVTAVDVPMFVSVALSLTATAMALIGFHGAGWIGRRGAISRIVWQADGRWVVTDGSGRQFEAVLRSETRVSTGLVWLGWDIAPPGRGSQATLLVSGDVSKPQLRRLVTRLRIDRQARNAVRHAGNPARTGLLVTARDP